MHKIFDQADKEGRHCYLESSRWEPNVKIYEKLGFRVVGEMECEEGGDACKVSKNSKARRQERNREWLIRSSCIQ